MDCILSEHKLHRVVKIEKRFKKMEKNIEESISEVKKEQTKVDEEFKKLKIEYEKKSIEFEEKKEKLELDLKKITELKSNQDLKGLFEFIEKRNEDKVYKIYCLGKNDYGQLGYKNKSQVETPTLISFFEDTNIRLIGSARSHTIVSTGKSRSFLIRLPII